MKPFVFPTLIAVGTVVLPTMASAQSSLSASNNPLDGGIYIEGLLGVDIPNDVDIEVDDFASDFTAETEVGTLFGLALGYSMPFDDLNVRAEAEFSARVSDVDTLDDSVNGRIDLENAEVAVFAAMGNVHFDYYLLPNFALTAGVGIGYADVDLDVLVVNDSGTGLAYQGRLGGRYSVGSDVTFGLAYTYFATADVTADDNILGVNSEAEYNFESHSFHASLAYTF